MNFGVIGYGKMGQIRSKIISSKGGCCLKSIYEPEGNPDLPFGAVRVKTHKDILKDNSIGAVFICVPNYLIKGYVIEAIESGKHVFCEKPPGINSEQVREMIMVERKYPHVKLMFGFNHRQHESMIHAKALIDSGEFGKILWIRGRYGKSVPEDFQNNWRSKKKYSGGGILLDQGIHMLDLFLMFCGDFEEVKAYVSNLFWHSDIEDNVFAVLKNSKGQVASLHSTMTQWRHLFALEIFMEKGHIIVNGLLTSSGTYGQEQLTYARNKYSGPTINWDKEEAIMYSIDNSWEREIDLFINSINNNAPVNSGGTADALKLMGIIDKIYHQK